MTRRRVEWSHWAKEDLEAVAEYIAEQQPATALRVIDRLYTCGERLSAHNLRGRRVPELQRLGIDTYRELIEGPWRVIYKPAKDHVVIVAIFDARRNAQRVLFQRMLQMR